MHKNHKHSTGRRNLTVTVISMALMGCFNLSLACSDTYPQACEAYFESDSCGEGQGEWTDKAINADFKWVCDGGGDTTGHAYCNKNDLLMICHYTDEYTDCDGTVYDTPESNWVYTDRAFGQCPSSPPIITAAQPVN